MAAICAAPVFAVARRTARATRASGGVNNRDAGGNRAPPLNRRGVVLSIPALLGASAAAPASAVAPPAYYDDTMEVIALTRSIISGEDLSEANFAKFQEKRDIWQGARDFWEESWGVTPTKKKKKKSPQRNS